MSQISEQADNHKGKDLIPAKSWGEAVSVSAELIRDRLLEIEKRIAPCKSRIIAVTKYFGEEAIVNGYKAGLRDFAESRAQESILKIDSLPAEVRENSTFHFIGHLQTNKVEKVVKYYDYIHSVDSLKLAQAISKAACGLNKREKILLQVNNAEEEQKFGYEKERLSEEMEEILKLSSIDVVGLMNMAPLGSTSEELTKIFGELRLLRDELEQRFKIKLPELSMGMSDDFEIACKQGSTMIRIGRKLFK